MPTNDVHFPDGSVTIPTTDGTRMFPNRASYEAWRESTRLVAQMAATIGAGMLDDDFSAFKTLDDAENAVAERAVRLARRILARVEGE